MTIARMEMVPVSEREHGRLQHGMRSSERNTQREDERRREVKSHRQDGGLGG